MSATVEIHGAKATIDGQWTSASKPLEELLNAILDPDGPSGADPNPALSAAQFAIEQLGGKIVSYDPTEWEEGVIY